MTQIEIHQDKINKFLNKLSALNMYRQDYHVIPQWGLEPIQHGYWLTSLAIEEVNELLKYLEECQHNLYVECLKRGEEKDIE